MSYAVDGEPTGFVALMGLQVERVDGDEARGHLVADERHLQPGGLVHGGVYASMAESLASVATWMANQDKVVSGQSNSTSFLRPGFAGDTLTAVGVPLHKGRTTWIWDVEVTGSAGKPLALTRMTVALRDPA